MLHAPKVLRRAAAIPGVGTLLLRAFLGVTFVFAASQKLANPAFFEKSAPGSIEQQLAGALRTSPIHSLLHLFSNDAVTIGVIIAIGELAVGLGTLIGLFARVAAFGGMLISLSLFLTISYTTTPYYLGSDIVFVFAWTPILIAGAPVFSLDAVIARRDARDEARVDLSDRALASPDPRRLGTELDRRAALRRLGTVGIAALGAAGLGGLVAGFGRALSKTPTFSPAPSPPSATSSASGASSSAGAPGGQRIATTAEVPVGGALAFTDAAQQIPAYVLQPERARFIAFSAVCTHAGCTVNFDRSVEEFICPCHGSHYSALTGAVLRGPAPLPLPSIEVTEREGEIYSLD